MSAPTVTTPSDDTDRHGVDGSSRPPVEEERRHENSTGTDSAVKPDSAVEADSAIEADRAIEAGETSAKRRTRLRAWSHSHPVAVGAGVVAAGLAVALILSLLSLGNDNALNTARSQALAAARTYSVELAGYDYRHLDRDFSVVVSHSTPSFRRSFTQASNALKKTLTQYHAAADATVVSAGVVSASPTRAVVLVFLTQKITNSTQKQTTTDRSQVEITLVDSGGTWLIDQVTLL